MLSVMMCYVVAITEQTELEELNTMLISLIQLVF